MYARVEEGEPPPPEESVSRTRLWLELPDRARVESDGRLAVKDGSVWWSWHESVGASTNAGSDRGGSTSIGTSEFLPLLAPARLLGLLEWEPQGRTDDVIRARATPRSPLDPDNDHVRFELHSLASGADEYAIEVDPATGVLVRVEASLDGEPFQVIRIIDFALDEPLPPETWVFEAPDGAEPEPIQNHFRRIDQPFAEVVASAGFTVLVPARVPDDWRLRSSYIPANERWRIGEHVSLSYRSDDGTADVMIGQARPGDPDHGTLLAGDGWSELERDGVTFRMRPRSDSWGQPQLYIEREGTGVLMTSDSLTNDDLIALALSLRHRAS
jgi:outer membrane lipoprotein-sorting protein